MLQVSYVDVAKVDRDVAYVAMTIHVCCKCVFKCFSYFIWILHMLQWLYTYIASVCSKCFTCFRCMLQVFLSECCICYSGYIHMLQMYVSIVSICCNRCCSPRALTHKQAHAAPSAPAPPGVVHHGGACSRLNICACALCSLSLSLIGACALCSLSHWVRPV
jgi:hypothetical protein